MDEFVNKFLFLANRCCFTGDNNDKKCGLNAEREEGERDRKTG